MKKYLMTVMTLFFVSLAVSADDNKLRVAIFDPIFNSTKLDNDMKSSMREIITSRIVNSGKYNTVERSLLEKVFQEQAFTNSGIVDDNNAVEIGKLTGANKVVVSLISPTGSKFKGARNMFSIKIIDVQTANIDKQKIKEINLNDWVDEVSALTDELIDVRPETPVHDTGRKQDLKSQIVEKMVAARKDNEYEFVLRLGPGYMPENIAHKDNYIEVLLNGDVVGGGTLSEGFDIRIKEKKHKKYKLEIRPTSTDDRGKTDMKSGKMQYNIDTSRRQDFEFLVQSHRNGKWTIYTVRLK